MNILMVLAGETLLNLKEVINKYNIEYIVAVDGGYDLLIQHKVIPDLLIGDLDSISKEVEVDELNVIKLNPQKDDTDFEYAINYINNKFENCNVYITGFISFKRIEHFYANLKMIKSNTIFLEKDTEISLLLPGVHTIRYLGYISFFALNKVEGLSLKKFKYTLTNYTLDINDTLCISNETKDEEGTVQFTKGELIVFKSAK